MFKAVALSALLAIVLTAAPAQALVMQESELKVSASGMVATATFTLNSPCTPYTLDWGDGEVVKQTEQKDFMCIQVLQDVTLDHTYEEPGNYTVSYVQNGRTSTQDVSVPTEVREFNLNDVQSITSLWVDPSEQLADEEYFLYSITLNDGEVITVKTAGFTTKEWIKKQFVAAGYTGDVDALVALAESKTEVEDPAPAPVEDELAKKIKLQKRVIELLKQLISLLGLR